MKRLSLRRARKSAGLTQEQLAAAAQVDQTTISALECGRRCNPSFDTVMRLAKALGVAPSELRFTAPEPAESVAEEGDRVVQTKKRKVA